MRAGEALAAAGQDSQLEVVHQDVLELMPRPFQTLYRDAYLDMVGRAPQIFGWLYELTDKPFQEDILRQAYEDAGIEYLSAEISMLPQNTITVDAEAGAKLMRLVEAMEDNEDVQNVHANFDLPDELLAEME